MNVRELISNLLDYDMDATVEILVESKEDSFDTNDFVLTEEKYGFGTYLTIKVVPTGHVAVDESDYENLKAEKLESDDLLEQMTSTVEEMQQKIYEFEAQK